MMSFKEYPVNPVYQNVPDDWWTNGYCTIFAYALQERFDGEIKALIVKDQNGEECLLHAMLMLRDGRFVDARGIHDADEKSELELFGCANMSQQELANLIFRRADEIHLEVETTDLDRLYELTPEDILATNSAHDYIDRNQELFDDLLMGCRMA